jgi:hypothetical protein
VSAALLFLLEPVVLWSLAELFAQTEGREIMHSPQRAVGFAA